MDNPKILVYAGPNGSGKSTITKGYPITSVYLNADDIKKHRGCSDLEAAQEAEILREAFLTSKRSFTFETVLSTERNLLLLDRAKKLGYFIEVVFVLTADSELNVKRVQMRVLKGGHDVPEDKIRNRYAKSLQILNRLNEIADRCIIVDNTNRPEVIYKKDADGEVILSNDYWSEKSIKGLIKRHSRTVPLCP